MKQLTQGDLYKSMRDSRSGLRDADRRSMMRLLFRTPAGSLLVFGTLQLLNNKAWLAGIEYGASLVLLFGVLRLRETPYLQGWIYGYLTLLYSFFLMIMAVPNASMAAFVWGLIMPVSAYLLLGKREGPVLSVPFMAVGCTIYYRYLDTAEGALAVIDLLNLLLSCAFMLVFMHLYERRREQAEQRLVDLAQTDALTGLANRSSFQSSLERTLRESARSQSEFALVVMDIDHFKVVNDTMGHEAGDWVLCHIAKLLEQRLRETDSVGRLGGEEFGLILRNTSSPDAFHLMDELRGRIADSEVWFGEARITVTASFGIAYWPRDGRHSHQLFRVADRRLYKSKKAGRNTIAESDLPLAGTEAPAVPG